MPWDINTMCCTESRVSPVRCGQGRAQRCLSSVYIHPWLRKSCTLTAGNGEAGWNPRAQRDSLPLEEGCRLSKGSYMNCEKRGGNQLPKTTGLRREKFSPPRLQEAGPDLCSGMNRQRKVCEGR